MTKYEHERKWATIDRALASGDWGSARALLMHMAADLIVLAPVAALKRLADEREMPMEGHTLHQHAEVRPR